MICCLLSGQWYWLDILLEVCRVISRLEKLLTRWIILKTLLTSYTFACIIANYTIMVDAIIQNNYSIVNVKGSMCIRTVRIYKTKVAIDCVMNAKIKRNANNSLLWMTFNNNVSVELFPALKLHAFPLCTDTDSLWIRYRSFHHR